MTVIVSRMEAIAKALVLGGKCCNVLSSSLFIPLVRVVRYQLLFPYHLLSLRGADLDHSSRGTAKRPLPNDTKPRPIGRDLESVATEKFRGFRRTNSVSQILLCARGYQCLISIARNFVTKLSHFFSNVFREAVSKVFLLTISLSCLSAGADTNFFPSLTVGTETYKNAKITSVTPSYVVVSHDEGALRIGFTNLPLFIQQQYGYDADAAARFATQEIDRKKKQAADHQQQQAAILAQNAWRGDPQAAQVKSVAQKYASWTRCTLNISNSVSEAWVDGLDDSIVQYYHRLLRLTSDVKAKQLYCENERLRLRQLKNRLPSEASADSPYYAMIHQFNVDTTALEDEVDKLNDMKSELLDLQASGDKATRTVLIPTAQSYSGMKVWATR